MRKITVLNRVSVDGYFASLNEANFGMDWFIQDPEVDKAVHNGEEEVSAFIFGADTYRGFERSWVPMLNNPDTPKHLKDMAQVLTDNTKYVFSTTIKEASWENTRLYSSEPVEVITRVKHEEGGNILIFGSGSIVQQLGNAGLIDEYMLIMTPIIAGEGKALFQGMKQTGLTLAKTQAFQSGNVLLHYLTANQNRFRVE
ncbi:dihydrofolate reductase family protein [Fictibacillus fluitans]|uniref:Dihydrofolate reductase family protein n=1 Tax=Fictibacillus fluitans TaxID=3058422 RepID=A0ABT8HY27_9BACL|nr:dihydrofolate reductase family protein [Fictibacillus sp. NE201]MDN4525152.1 dihydrofolate reductase family protein [Fictibacillus sp. NE201]